MENKEERKHQEMRKLRKEVRSISIQLSCA